MDSTVIKRKFRERYFYYWNTLKGKKLFLFYLLHYTALFLILQGMVFSFFRDADKSFIWALDGMPNAFSFMVYLSQTIRNGIKSLLSGNGWTIPLYDFRFGIARQYWFFEPLQWLAVLCPWNQIDIFYDIITIIQYYLVGMAFSLFGFYFKQKPTSILIGAVSYTFCGFTLFAGVRHLSFMTPVIILPILVIGVEEVFKNRKTFLLTLCVFLSVISNVYFTYMLVICTGIYVIVRFFDISKEKNLRRLISTIVYFAYWGGLGILLGAFSMLPNLLAIFGTGRVGDNASYVGSFWKYAASYYYRLVINFTITPSSPGSWTWLGFSALTFPALILLFTKRKKEENTLRKMFLILTVMLCCPAVAYAMSGFNTFSNRWCFIYAFAVSAILMFKCPYLLDIDRRDLLILGIFVVIYFAFGYFVIDPAYSQKDSLIFLGLTMVLLFICAAIKKENHLLIFISFLIITCFSVRYSAALIYHPNYQNYVLEFVGKGKAYQEYNSSPYSSFDKSIVKKVDNSFYRVASNAIPRSAINASFYYGINGVSYYNNIYLYPNYINWLDEMELSRNGNDMMHYYSGLETCSSLLCLTGTKYYIQRGGEKDVFPYGFQVIESIQNGSSMDLILKNKNSLPLGYTYNCYLSDNKYNELSGLEKQEAQLQAVVLNSEPTLSNISEGNINLYAKQIPATVLNTQGLEWSKNKLRIKDKEATITLLFNGLPKTETYLRVVNLDLTDGTSTRRWRLTAETDETSASAHFDANAYLYAHKVKTQLIDLGYSEDGFTTCTITFPAKGTFLLEDLQIWCQPMDKYEEWTSDLRSEPLENIETNWRGLTGDLSVSENKILCLAIPYDKGWTAYMDGQKVELLQANTAFMAIEVPMGKHEIELRYMLPGLPEGIVLSLLGLAILVVTNIYQGRKI